LCLSNESIFNAPKILSLKSGRVETWDNETFGVLERDEDKFILQFNGKRLKGLYRLIQIKRCKGERFR